VGWRRLEGGERVLLGGQKGSKRELLVPPLSARVCARKALGVPEGSHSQALSGFLPSLW
jgi:hypothetical protein